MAADSFIHSNAKTARIAGLLYLLVVLGGIMSLAYAPSVVEGNKDGAMLVAAIKEHEMLFRFSIAAGLVCYTAFLLLPLALYRLLVPYGQQAATAMVALSVSSVPIAFANMINRADILSLLGNEPSLAGMPAAEIQMQILLSLESY